jgi:hypothetical protein
MGLKEIISQPNGWLAADPLQFALGLGQSRFGNAHLPKVWLPGAIGFQLRQSWYRQDAGRIDGDRDENKSGT